jgi:hypothetical protein
MNVFLETGNPSFTKIAITAKLVPTLADRVCRMVSATDPHGRNLAFLDRSRYLFFQVAPQLNSRG